MLEVGTKVCITSPDGDLDYGKIILIEPEPDLGIDWLYIQSDTDSMNINSDPKIKGLFWRIIESTSNYLSIV